MKLTITDISYAAGTLIVTVEKHLIGNDFNFAEIHDLIEEYGAVNEIVFNDTISDLNQVFDIALTLRSFKPKVSIALITNHEDLDCLNISNALSPIPFNRLIMNGVSYKIIDNKPIKIKK